MFDICICIYYSLVPVPPGHSVSFGRILCIEIDIISDCILTIRYCVFQFFIQIPSAKVVTIYTSILRKLYYIIGLIVFCFYLMVSVLIFASILYIESRCNSLFTLNFNFTVNMITIRFIVHRKFIRLQNNRRNVIFRNIRNVKLAHNRRLISLKHVIPIICLLFYFVTIIYFIFCNLCRGPFRNIVLHTVCVFDTTKPGIDTCITPIQIRSINLSFS